MSRLPPEASRHLDETPDEAFYDLVRRRWMYVNQPGTVTLSYDCRSIYSLREVIDMRLSVRRGWNLLEFRDTQLSQATPQLTTNTHTARVLPVDAFPQELYWGGETADF